MKKAIYKITNKVNGKIYIGQSKNPQQRWASHTWNLTNGTSLIHYAIEKYGKENFSFEILGWFEDYNEKEKYYIILYNSKVPNGYNILDGGEEPPLKKGEDSHWATISEETAKLIQQDLMDFSLTQQDIIKKYNVSTNVVRHIKEGTSWKDEKLTYPLRPSEDELNEIKADKIKDLLINSTLTQKEIAEQVGWSRSAVTMINNGQNHYDPTLSYPLRKQDRHSRPIVQLDKDTEEFIAEYDSIKNALKALNKTSTSSISKCLNGTGKTAHGFKWKYKEDYK